MGFLRTLSGNKTKFNSGIHCHHLTGISSFTKSSDIYFNRLLLKVLAKGNIMGLTI